MEREERTPNGQQFCYDLCRWDPLSSTAGNPLLATLPQSSWASTHLQGMKVKNNVWHSDSGRSKGIDKGAAGAGAYVFVPTDREKRDSEREREGAME